MPSPSRSLRPPGRALAACLLALPAAAWAQPTCPPASGLLKLAADRVVQEGALQTGGAADYLLSTATERSCKQADAAAWLPVTCSGPLGPQALVALRQRLILDLAALPRRFVPSAIQRDATDAERGLRMAIALIDSLLAGADLPSLGGALWKSSALAVSPGTALCAALIGEAPDDEPLRRRARSSPRRVTGGWLAAPPPPELLRSGPPEPVTIAARLLQRLGSEPPALPGDDEAYVQLIARELTAAGIEQGEQMAPGRREQALRLIQAARRLQALRSRLGSGADAGQYIETAKALADVLVPAVSLVAARPVGLPTRLPSVVERLASGQLSSLLIEATAMGSEASGVTPPGAAVEAARLGVALATARDEDEIKRKLRALVLPWSEPWMLDLNGSIPRLESGDGKTEQSLFGDLSLGYHGARWGIQGRAMYNLYNRQADFILQRNSRALGDLEGWAEWPVSERLRAEARLSGGASYYGTRYDNQVRSTFRLDRESSTVGRATALGALRWVPTSSLAAGLWFGLGGQYEDYRTSNTVSIADRGSTSEKSLGLLIESRLRAQWRMLPGILGVRARADLLRFSITRNSQVFKVDQTVVNESTTSTASQIDLNARLFIDLDALGFLGFLPSAHVGVDVFQQSADGQTLTTTVPLLGAGLRRDTF